LARHDHSSDLAMSIEKARRYPTADRSHKPRRATGADLFVAKLALCMFLLSATVVRADQITLVETGSSLLYPVFNVWAAEYMKTHTGVRVVTGSTGSDEGIKQAISGAVQIGTSDAYMSDAEIRQNPQIINVPMAISAQTINYNLPDLNATAFRLDGSVLAGIYAGTIKTWDDKAIAALNPGLTLPHHDIVPVHRTDGSGDTFVFTQYLSFATTWWEGKFRFGRSLTWPDVSGALGATGNGGMLETIRHTPYSIGYIGVSFHNEVAKAQLGTALLKSYSGEFLLPTPETIQAAAAALTPRTPKDERLALVNAPGAHAYPLINYEYAIVSTKQSDPAIAAAIRKFLLWAIAPDETNETYLEDAHFIPLPAHIWVLSHDQIQLIK
jgi:phosphate transport system substrate-binding protein